MTLHHGYVHRCAQHTIWHPQLPGAHKSMRERLKNMVVVTGCGKYRGESALSWSPVEGAQLRCVGVKETGDGGRVTQAGKPWAKAGRSKVAVFKR